MSLTFLSADSGNLVDLHLVATDDLDTFLDGQSDLTKSWAATTGFTAAAGQVLVVPASDGALECAVVGYGGPKDRARKRFILGGARASLPDAAFRLLTQLTTEQEDTERLGWLLAGYRFDRYKSAKPPKAQLAAPHDADRAHRLEVIAAGETLTRDLINTPAEDMGPPELQSAMHDLAEEFGATLNVVEGAELLDENYPLIHTVGRAAEKTPRLMDLHWGNAGPMLTLVGKGVCFDTGGLNLKPGGSMGLMKKDMGGAATVLGLARMIMGLGLDLRLRVLVPAVENAVAGNAFRPGDVFTSRKGLTVEINNTDAEGRLVLADALALADEDAPDLIISMATLTGAARVAVGPDLAPFYCDDQKLSDELRASASRVADPVWELPFHDPYEPMIEPGIADLDNAPAGGFAGSITAALFLRRFVDDAPYMHFDIYGWQPSAAAARPKGGVGQGARALLDALPKMLKL
ncbi:MAG: leucyl aminopeptidase family protein [Pseudomonadota bacterium]